MSTDTPRADKAATPPHPRDHETLRRESTRDPIFLLQERRPVWSENVPAGICFDHESSEFVNDEGSMTTGDAILAGAGAWVWSTVTVFLTRAEGEEWASARSYRFAHGTRVYCVAAEGELCGALAAATVGGRYS